MGISRRDVHFIDEFGAKILNRPEAGLVIGIRGDNEVHLEARRPWCQGPAGFLRIPVTTMPRVDLIADVACSVDEMQGAADAQVDAPYVAAAGIENGEMIARNKTGLQVLRRQV